MRIMYHNYYTPQTKLNNLEYVKKVLTRGFITNS